MMSVLRKASAAAAVLALASAAAVAQEAPSPAQDPANWRQADPENLLRMSVKGQNIFIELRPDFAPNHVAQVKTITRAGHYDGTAFHRVIDRLMVQGGEVTTVHQLDKPYPVLDAEFTFRRDPATAPMVRVGEKAGMVAYGYLKGAIVESRAPGIAALMADSSVESWALHCPGVASMARATSVNSADTQFFLTRYTNHDWDTVYTIWGHVLSGLDVVRGIKAGKDEDNGQLPVDQADRLSTAVIVADLPPEKRPIVYVQRADGPKFQEALAALDLASISDPCELPSVSVQVEAPKID